MLTVLATTRLPRQQRESNSPRSKPCDNRKQIRGKQVLGTGRAVPRPNGSRSWQRNAPEPKPLKIRLN